MCSFTSKSSWHFGVEPLGIQAALLLSALSLSLSLSLTLYGSLFLSTFLVPCSSFPFSSPIFYIFYRILLRLMLFSLIALSLYILPRSASGCVA